jgi:hypothetical protein
VLRKVVPEYWNEKAQIILPNAFSSKNPKEISVERESHIKTLAEVRDRCVGTKIGDRTITAKETAKNKVAKLNVGGILKVSGCKAVLHTPSKPNPAHSDIILKEELTIEDIVECRTELADISVRVL